MPMESICARLRAGVFYPSLPSPGSSIFSEPLSRSPLTYTHTNTNPFTLRAPLQADVFTEWDPKAKEPKPSDEITIKEVTVEEGGNPLDVLNMENRQEPTVDVEAIDVEYDPWSQDPEAARPPRSGDQPVYDSEGPSRAETGDASQYEESEGPTRVNTAVENSGKNEESATTNGKFGFGSLFKRKQ